MFFAAWLDFDGFSRVLPAGVSSLTNTEPVGKLI